MLLGAKVTHGDLEGLNEQAAFQVVWHYAREHLIADILNIALEAIVKEIA